MMASILLDEAVHVNPWPPMDDGGARLLSDRSFVTAAGVSDDGHMGIDARPGEPPGRFTAGDFDPAALLNAKEGRRVAVCIPARNEASTVGDVVRAVVSELTDSGGGLPLIDEVVVVDDHSGDTTAEQARRAGGRVVVAGGPVSGKGQAMRVAAEAVDADLVVFVDADVTNFGPHFVTGLLGPLLIDDSFALVKGFYQRPFHGADEGGGRVTELMAKPVIDLLFPHLAAVEQPLAGETAIRRCVLDKCELADGYAVELALLIDVSTIFGVSAIAQVDLGRRVHRNRPLTELRPQATDVLQAALERSRSH
ncbi:MAG: glucosyl-3-phosphoglycerate synthase [Acidimicrobiales bacterium]